MDNKLGGYLLGYGVKKKTGELTEVMFDKPIHNTITKHCINNLLMFNGTNAISTDTSGKDYCSMFVQCIGGNSGRYGVINFSAIGDGFGQTSTDDNALVHQIGPYSSTKKTGPGWSQTTIDDQNAIFKLRISHIHSIDSSFDVKEIGWFNRIYPDGEYSMSARVQLDTPVSVESGDEFYSIYEIQVGFQDVERFSDLGGFGGGYKVNCGIYYPSYAASNYCFPYIDYNGVGLLHPNNHSTAPTTAAIHITPPWTSINFRALRYTTNIAKWKSLINTYAQGYDYSYSFFCKDYVQDSFYRDTVFTLNPAMLGENCYGLVFDGTLYRFGTFDENDNFTPTPIAIKSALQVTVRQSWSTDLLQPSA